MIPHRKFMVMGFCIGGRSTCPTHPACGVRSAKGPPSRALVGRWPVDRGYGHVVEAQVQAQLAAVVNQVMQHEAAERGDARHREHLLAVAAARRPAGVLGAARVWRQTSSK